MVLSLILKSLLMPEGFQIFPPPTTPPEPAPPDHLLTPSSILRQLKENAVSQSQSSLEEINCKKSKYRFSVYSFKLTNT